MKIVQVNTRDIRGGAARAAYRLHQALRQVGEESQMLVRWQTILDPTVLALTDQDLEVAFDAPEWQAIQRHISRNLTEQAKTLFTLPYPGVDLSAVEAIAQADIIHLHWVSHLISPTSLRSLLDLGKPVVWTLHDMWPFTGGCHYASGCTGYEQSCEPCPQLRDDPYGLPQAVLQDRIELLANYHNLTIVTPSHWLAGVARQSRLFGDRRIEVIPNPIETEIFQPLAKASAKKRLGIPPNAFTFVAQSSVESRKEFPQLIAAIRRALRTPRFRKLADAGRIHFIFFGSQSQPLDAPDIPFTHLGWSNKTRQLVTLYSAGDAFILPSLEDNLPNVMLESISCGTPLIAFDVGGMPDVIQPNKTGWLAPVGDFETLAQLLVDCALNPEDCRALQPLCRHEAEAHYSMEVIAQRFLALYRELLPASAPEVPVSVHSGSEGRERVRAIAPSSAAATLEASPPITPIDDTLGAMDTLEAPVEAYGVAPFDASVGSHFAAIQAPLLMRSLLQDSQERQLLERQIQLAETDLMECQQTIVAMKTSKFWKLRSRWFQLKQRLGLPAEE